ncbi:MAG: hypothetical protein M3R00_01420, partial [Pseudomonadota bacterium]|nr:hypothetical protein [Pseudomonadota bacterium]
KPVIKAITEKPLFGQGELPGQINTHYQLAGVLYTPNPKQRKAFFFIDTGTTDIYTVGEQLKEGGKLYEVNVNHVLLLRNGQIEKLYLLWEGGPSAKSKSVTTGVSNDSDSDSDDDAPSVSATAESVSAEMPGMESNSGNQPDVNAWRDRIKELQEKYQGRIDPNAQGVSGSVMPTRPMPMKMRGRYGRD